MAKQNWSIEKLAIVAIAVVALYLAFGQGEPAAAPNNGGSGSGVDLCQVVQPQASFTGQRMFLEGTAVTGPGVRIIKNNGGGTRKDLGNISMNSGTQNTDPNGNYDLYWAFGDATYYPEVEKYTAPCQEATDDKVGVLCAIDSNPTVTSFDEYGNVQSETANAQALTTDEVRDIKLRIRVASDQCYGAPDADIAGANAICFKYNTTVLQSVQADTGAISTPYTISSVYSAAGFDIACYQLKKLKDNEQVDINVKLESAGTEPSQDHNISIYLDDVSFDLDQDTLAEIIGFNDEDKNALGAAVVTGDVIKIS